MHDLAHQPDHDLLARLDATAAAQPSRAMSPAELAELARPIPRPDSKEITECAPRARTPREILHHAWAMHECDLSSPVLNAPRVRVAYRLAREMARHLGLIAHDEALSSVDLTRWSLPRPPLALPRGPFSPMVKAMLEEVRQYPADRFGLTEREAGPPIMPPDNPTLLHVWSRIMSTLSDFLGVEHGAPLEPEYGRLGLMGTITPEYARRWWPDPILLVQYEALLVDEVIEAVVRDGAHAAHRGLYAVHGFAVHEVRGLIRLSQVEMQARTEADVEMDKAQISLRLEDLAARARLACDQRVELGAVKQLSIVRGVTRAEPEDAASEFVRTVRKVASEQGSNPQLPGDSGPSTAS